MTRRLHVACAALAGALALGASPGSGHLRAAERVASAKVRAVDTGATLPELTITRTPDTFPSGRTFAYAFAKDPGGRATVELWFRGREATASLITALHDVALERSGEWKFLSRFNLPPGCDRRCVLLLRVKRGGHERTIEMGLRPRHFMLEGRRGNSSRSGPDASLHHFRISRGSVRNRDGAPVALGSHPTSAAFVASVHGDRDAPESVRNVRAELWFRERRGPEQIISSRTLRSIASGAQPELSFGDFRLGERRGSLVVRLVHGRSAVETAFPLRPSGYRVSLPSRVRDRR